MAIVDGPQRRGFALRAGKLPRQQKNQGNLAALLNDLKACKLTKDLERGRRVHDGAILTGADSNIFVASKLVEMYAKCGSMLDAQRAFNRIYEHDVVLWNVLILGYADNGQGEAALETFQQMDCAANPRTFVAAVKACSSLAVTELATQDKESGRMVKVKALERGRRIHTQATSRGFDTDIFVANTLIDMYAKCGSMVEARKIFEEMGHRDVISWNALISGYAEQGEDHGEALRLFATMLNASECESNDRTFVAALKACAGMAAASREQSSNKDATFLALERGMAIHSRARVEGYDSNVFVANTLIDMYVKCGRMAEARRVFDSMQQRDVVSWNILLLGYSETKSSSREAFALFAAMQADKQSPDARTFTALLKACTSLAMTEDGSIRVTALEKGMAIHSQAVERRCNTDIFVRSALVEMYAKCGFMDSARQVFESMEQRGLVLWNTLILGYAENGETELALALFQRMMMEERNDEHDCCSPDSRTFVAALKACSGMVAVETGTQANDDVRKLALERCMAIHTAATKVGLASDLFVSSSLVDLYGKCGSMNDARRVFDKMAAPSLVSWNSLILGYADNGQEELAYELFVRMTSSDCGCDCRTLVAVLKSCGNVAALDPGKKVHAEACKRGLESEALVATGVVDFYGKCGSMGDARKVFDSTEIMDGVAWTALIAGYSRQGHTELALELFQDMLSSSSSTPDSVTFLAVLSACSRAGLVDRGKKIFEVMLSSKVAAKIEHYHCMLDLLGRANQLDEAVLVIKTMPFEANAVTWTSVLAASCKWKNVRVAVEAFERLTALDRGLAAAYVLMTSLYESLGMQEDQSRIISAMQENTNAMKQT